MLKWRSKPDKPGIYVWGVAKAMDKFNQKAEDLLVAIHGDQLVMKIVSIFNLIVAFTAAAMALTSCGMAASDAKVASYNLSTAADNFELNRRIVFYNGITGAYMLSIEGLCSIGNALETDAVTVTCKVGPTAYKKHFLGLSDNVTYFAEQLESSAQSTAQYRVVFKPSVIVPNIDLK